MRSEFVTAGVPVRARALLDFLDRHPRKRWPLDRLVSALGWPELDVLRLLQLLRDAGLVEQASHDVWIRYRITRGGRWWVGRLRAATPGGDQADPQGAPRLASPRAAGRDSALPAV